MSLLLRATLGFASIQAALSSLSSSSSSDSATSSKPRHTNTSSMTHTSTFTHSFASASHNVSNYILQGLSENLASTITSATLSASALSAANSSSTTASADKLSSLTSLSISSSSSGTSRSSRFSSQLGTASSPSTSSSPRPTTPPSTTRSSRFAHAMALNASTSAANATGFTACQSSIVSWSSAWLSPSDCGQTTTSFVVPSLSTFFPNASVYTTLCDGYPRAHGTATVFTYEQTYYDYQECTSLIPITNAPPFPTCTINSHDCHLLWSSYTATNLYGSNIPETLNPKCSSECVASAAPIAANFQQCRFEPANVRLLYFPVSVQGNRLCPPYNYTTVYSNATGPVTAVSDGTTFTSGTAYISFDSLIMTDLCGGLIGTPTRSFILPIPSRNVQTVDSIFNYVPLNFADLNMPIPAAVYEAAPLCQGNTIFSLEGCPTIYDGFAPALAIPTAVVDLQAPWSSCYSEALVNPFADFFADFLFDPPTALQPASKAATPTLPGGGGGGGGGPKPTTAHTTANQPTQTQTQPGNGPTQTSAPGSGNGNGGGGNGGTGNGGTGNGGGGSGSGDPGSGSTGGTSGTGASNGGTGSTGGTGGTNEGGDPGVGGSTGSDPGTGSTGGSTGSTSGTSGSGAGDPGTGSTGGNSGSSDGGNNGVSGGSNGAGGESFVPVPVQTGASGSQGSDPGSSNTGNAQNGGTGSSSESTLADSDPTIQQASCAPGQCIINGTTLRPGQQATIDGTVASVASGGQSLVFGGNTVPITDGTIQLPGATAAPVGPLSLSRDGSSYIVDGTALAPGETVTEDGHTIVAPSDGGSIVVDGQSTLSLSQGAYSAVTLPTLLSEGVLALGSQTLTEYSIEGQTGIVVDGVTLIAGSSSATIDGVVLSMGTGGLLSLASGTSATVTENSQITSARHSHGITKPAAPTTTGTATSIRVRASGVVLVVGLIAVLML